MCQYRTRVFRRRLALDWREEETFPESHRMQTSISRRSLLNYIGIGILVVGMGTADGIYWRSLKGTPGRDESLGESPYESRVYEQTMERNVGVFGLLQDQSSRSVASMKEPKALAITIAVASMAAAGGCFLAAGRMPTE